MQTSYTKWVDSSFLEENEKEIIFRIYQKQKEMNAFLGYLEFGYCGMKRYHGAGLTSDAGINIS